MTGMKAPMATDAAATEQLPVSMKLTDYGDTAAEKLIRQRKIDRTQVGLRVACTVTAVTAMVFMVTAEEASIASVYGFHLPVRSKWSFSYSFEYLVGVSAVVAAHCFLQLLIGVLRLRNRSSTFITSRNYGWLLFAGDQVFSYATMSAGSASSGVTNLNRTGIRHTALPNFCKSLRGFCDHVTVAIALTFMTCTMLAISTVLDVIWLCKW